MHQIEEVVALGLLIILAVFLLSRTWNMSGIPVWETRIIQEDFERCDDFLKPLVLQANSFWRNWLRVAIFLSVNTGLLLFFAIGWEELSWAVGVTLVFETGVIFLLTAKNKKKYRRNLEECHLFTHPSINRLVGRIEDRPERPFRGNHLVTGGRLLTVVSRVAGVEERTKLLLPIQLYGQSAVEETHDDVMVFYQSWKEARLIQDADHQSAIGVYVGFRRHFELCS